MLKIDDNMNIELTRGDTLTLTVALFREVPPVPPATQPSLVPYVPDENDELRFAVSKGYKGDTDYELQFKAEIPHDLTFTVGPEKTTLDYYTYNYDVEITFEDGTVDTVISGSLKITGEAD